MENRPEIKESCKHCGKEYYHFMFVHTDKCEMCGSIAWIDYKLVMAKSLKKNGFNPVPWESYAPWIDEGQKFKEWKNKQ